MLMKFKLKMINDKDNKTGWKIHSIQLVITVPNIMTKIDVINVWHIIKVMLIEKLLKACVCYFLSNVYFSPNNSP